MTFFGLKDTTGWPPSEEVKVSNNVHLNVIKVHFVIWSSIYLRKKRVMISTAKTIISI